MISPEALARLEETILGEAAHLTKHDVERLSGISDEEAGKLWRALGFPDATDTDVAFTQLDVDALIQTQVLRSTDLLSESSTVQVTRAMGQAMSHLAEAQMDIAVDRLSSVPGVAEIAKEQPDQLVDLAIASSAVLRTPLEMLVLYVYRRHLLAAAQRYLTGATSTLNDGVAQLAVGFADISGFTSHTRELSQEELTTLISTFEATAFDVVVQGGARVVKTLGDSVMFVTDSPSTAATIALELAATFEDDTLGVPRVHVGVAYGPAVTRGGDVFGTAVNVASRCTSIARGGTVVIDKGMTEAIEADDRFVIRRMRPQRVRGFESLHVAAVRWADPDGPPDEDRAARLERRLERASQHADRVRAHVEAALDVIPALRHHEPEA